MFGNVSIVRHRERLGDMHPYSLNDRRILCFSWFFSGPFSFPGVPQSGLQPEGTSPTGRDQRLGSLPPVEETHACENITLPILLKRAVLRLLLNKVPERKRSTHTRAKTSKLFPTNHSRHVNSTEICVIR